MKPPDYDQLGDLQALLQRGYRYALALTHNADEADDVLQDAWVAVLNAGEIRSPGVLFRAIRTRFIDRYRRRRLVVMSSYDTEPGHHMDERTSPDLEIAVVADQLERALGSLRAEERELLFLSAVEGYSADEIGELTKRTSGAVRVLLHRVRRKLRAVIEQQERSSPEIGEPERTLRAD